MSDSFEKSVDARAAAIAAAKTAAKTAAIAAAKTAAKKAATEFDPDGEKYDEKTGAELAELMPLNIDKPTDRPKEVPDYFLGTGDIRRGFYPERTHEGAFEAWVWHRDNEDDPNSPFDWYKHKSSIDPRNGMLLKGMGHESAKRAIDYEKKHGRHFVKGSDGRYYLEKIPAPLLTRRNPSQTFTSTPPAAEK
jgi:hypothetical protein